MKFFQVLNFYPSYLEQFYGANPGLGNAPFEEQVTALVADGFGACHTFAPHMGRLGYTPFTAIGNNHFAQLHWLREQHSPLEDQRQWMFEILRKQIDWFKPDILYSSDPVTFESGFLRSLSHKPAVVLGFIGSPVPSGIDWSSYDVILSNSTLCLQLAPATGAKSCSFFWPGVPSFIIDKVRQEPKSFDLVFPGSWTAGHSHRNTQIQDIAKAAVTKGGFTPAFFLNTQAPLPEDVARFDKGPLWGMEMYRALKQGRIVFNAGLDYGGNEAGNMRAFESTAIGSFLLTEHHHNISRYFEPGREVETYRTPSELLEKIVYYLGHSEQREEIAAAGQLRFFRDHVMDRRLEDLDALIRSRLPESGRAPAPVQPEVDLYDQAYRWGWEQPELRQTVYLCYKTPDFADNARRFFDSAEFRASLEMLRSLGHGPATNGRVLDIGCGNGVGSYSLARSGYRVTGIDSSTGELAGIRAAEKLLGLDGAQFEIRQASSNRLEFPDQSFDIVWMREVLHHITDLVPFLNEVKRVLKPGGILCCMRDVIIWNEQQRSSFFANHPFYHITHDEGCYYLREYQEAFQTAGLITEKELDPLASVINTFPSEPPPGAVYDPALSMANPVGYDLFSFFLRKPAAGEAAALERFTRLQSNKEALLQTSREPVAANATPIPRKVPAPVALPVPPAAPMIAAATCDPADLAGSFPGVSFGDMIQVLGVRNIAIGEGSCIGDSSWLNVCIRGDDQIRLRIGNCVLVDRQAVISTAGTLEIGDYCVFAPRVYISDADHIYADIMQPVIQQGATYHRSVVVEENCWLGINTVIAGNLTLGRGSVVGANAVVTRDIPPFSVVVGNPAQIVKMFSPRSNAWERTRGEADIQRILEERREIGMPSREEYRQILKQNARITYLDPILSGRGNLI